MSSQSNTMEHIFQLSSLDQSLPREYIRYALCFPHTNTNAEATANRLVATVKRIVTHLPILAGNVRPATVQDSNQTGKLEVVVTLQDVTNFMPTVKHLNPEGYQYNYEELATAAFPPIALNCEHFMPLPYTPDQSTGVVFALHATFIDGGLVVALFLHNSVADTTGIHTIITHLSSDLPTCKLTCQDLKDEAIEQSRLRDRLSGSRGIRSDLTAGMRPDITSTNTVQERIEDSTSNSNTCRAFLFNLALIDETTVLLNQRFQDIQNDRSVTITTFDTLAAILWKAVSRARANTGLYNEQQPERTSKAILPTNIRTRMEPVLDDSYFGGTTVHCLATSDIVRLSLPYEIGSLAHTARLIRNATAIMSDQLVRSVIAGINESEHVQSTPNTKLATNTDLVIADWSTSLPEEAEMGLGTGQPEWLRKLSRNCSTSECIILPQKKDNGLWEVLVELKSVTVDSMLKDEGLMAFVTHVA